MKTERRKHPRVDFAVQASFAAEGLECTDQRCENISMSGLLLRTEAPLPVGTRGRLLIVLVCGEERLEVRAECRVSRVMEDAGGKAYGMGLEYISLDPDSSIALYNVVRYQGGLDRQERDA
ncbi:MAG: PilZ domain-containing protein [Thermodesulfobacteriota bacterium]